ncbi:MAG TPA: DJ-1/PfpI family protein [Burkholderiaceae bacterium]|jgi:transcriptional regulator GlxA family with amidase domain|nr:DJ-1/PfpI family protein [Burkholderiaceae bacterium]
MSQTQRKRVGIVLFDDVEVLDFAGPYEVLTVTRLDESKRWETESPFDVLLVAEHDRPVRCMGGMRVIPDTTLQNCPPLDLLVVPGGWGTRKEAGNKTLVGWIRERSGNAELTASVCTGARLLATAGILEGRRATTHWNSLPWLEQTFPGVRVEHELHVVDDGNLVTSAGISAGIELSLELVKRYHGDDVARNTARFMEYRYPYDNTRRV